MTITEFAALGEFVASLGVLITLIYLAIQMRQNTKAVRLSTSHPVTEEFQVVFSLLASSPGVTELAPPDGILLTQFDPQPEYVGMSLTEIAALRNVDAATAFVQLINESEAMTEETGKPADSMIGTSMIESDILELLIWPHTNICTDGGIVDLHPRARGSFPRVLGRYVRELHALTVESAVHRMSGLSAAHMGFTDRGLIRPGMKADLVLFDLEAVIDNATIEDSQALSSGISQVWVNGITVFENGIVSGNLPGRVIRRNSP